MLGFDALGRLALGQLPKSSSIVLPASVGSYAVTGTAIALKVSEAASAGAYSLTGISASFKASLPPAAGAYTLTGISASFAITEAVAAGSYPLSGIAASFKTSFLTAAASGYNLAGVAATFRTSLATISGSYILTGYAANEPIVEIASGGSYAITLVPTPLVRTGGDFDQVYGGIGHYLEEIERARQLAKITRKTPAPIVHEIRPWLQPLASPPVARQPPAVDLGAVAAQRMAEQPAQQQAAVLKRRRQATEILWLAS
jgi:hypothetical protein